MLALTSSNNQRFRPFQDKNNTPGASPCTTLNAQAAMAKMALGDCGACAYCDRQECEDSAK